jgi:hypothetical protein
MGHPPAATRALKIVRDTITRHWRVKHVLQRAIRVNQKKSTLTDDLG